MIWASTHKGIVELFFFEYSIFHDSQLDAVLLNAPVEVLEIKLSIIMFVITVLCKYKR